jgi:hypothetical protein
MFAIGYTYYVIVTDLAGAILEIKAFANKRARAVSVRANKKAAHLFGRYLFLAEREV